MSSTIETLTVAEALAPYRVTDAGHALESILAGTARRDRRLRVEPAGRHERIPATTGHR